jgi:hypothetical protein
MLKKAATTLILLTYPLWVLPALLIGWWKKNFEALHGYIWGED